MENANMALEAAPEVHLEVPLAVAAPATKKNVAKDACPSVWSAAPQDTVCLARSALAMVLADTVQAVEAAVEAAADQATMTMIRSLQPALSTLPLSPHLRSSLFLPSTTILSLHSALAPCLLGLDLVMMGTAPATATVVMEAAAARLLCPVSSWASLL